MKGYELIFMAPRSRRHHGKPVLDAVIDIAKSQGIDRYTRRVNAEGSGTTGHIHSAHFFELADEPEELMLVLDETAADHLIQAVEAEGIYVFLVRRPVEYHQLGQPAE
ncbi:MAG: hypothetical protein EPN34_10625 [Burkholderiaceae bacterium]|jgi:PII-like signaling protein|nr:MAG: hypothetical protein EPN34_10625 [Burkholderiaceae bacterium]